VTAFSAPTRTGSYDSLFCESVQVTVLGTHKVRRAPAVLSGGDRGAVLPASHQPGQVLVAHQLVDCAGRHLVALAAEMGGHLPAPVHAFRGVHRGAQRSGQVGVKTARFDGRAVLQFRYVRGATWTPCSVSTRQIDSTR
jgi:hypothetical protein